MSLTNLLQSLVCDRLFTAISPLIFSVEYKLLWSNLLSVYVNEMTERNNFVCKVDRMCFC